MDYEGLCGCSVVSSKRTRPPGSWATGPGVAIGTMAPFRALKGPLTPRSPSSVLITQGPQEIAPS